MLAKTQRLSVAAFAAVFATGKRLHTPHLSIVYVPAPVFRAAVVVGKKVAKRAVLRNEYRRRVYAVIAETVRREPLSVSCIFLVRPSFATLTKQEQRDVVVEALQSLRGRL